MNKNDKKYINSHSKQFFAFNIWDCASAKAIIDAASYMKTDVILQTSMAAYKKLNKKEIRDVITYYAGQKNMNAYLHLDHCRDVEVLKTALDYGWDSVMIDASDKELSENIHITNQVIDMARDYEAMVEAEIGIISGVEEDMVRTEEGVASLRDVKKFIVNTDVDMLAVAIGTAHGMYKGTPVLHYDMIEDIRKYTDLPLVIHGGTGLTDAVFQRLFSFSNVKKINISTDVKLSYRRGILESEKLGYMKEDGFNPMKVEENIHTSIMNMAIHKLQLCRDEDR